MKQKLTCKKLDKIAIKIPFCFNVDQCDVMLPITGKHAEKPTPVKKIKFF